MPSGGLSSSASERGQLGYVRFIVQVSGFGVQSKLQIDGVV